MPPLEEKEYRAEVARIYAKLEKAFDPIDPDLAECEISQGALTVTFGDRTKLILSTQPSVGQVWLAFAAKGVAYHFNYENGQWMDDKGKDIELLQCVRDCVQQAAGIVIAQ